MANLDTKFASISQEWATPDDLYEAINKEFNFTLDAAATAENTKAPFFYDKESNGLLSSWQGYTVWLNPPYGSKTAKMVDWVIKAYNESLLGVTSVLLLPARTNTNWFHEYCFKYAEVRFIRGRPRFNNVKHGLPQPLCFVIFHGKKGGES